MRAVVFVFVLLAVALGADPAAAERRVALVVGNSGYVHAPALPNPRRDAEAMAARLRGLGFDVELGLDLDKPGMDDLFRRFGRKVDGADVGLFFYAGHGLQVGGRNYLAPTDATLEHEADLDFEAVPLDVVLAQIERGARLSLIFLDACRDNPLARTLARGMGATRSATVGRGLARVEAGLGTLIAFATAPNEVAFDGAGRNSPFTLALLEHIETPGLEIEQMLKRVTGDVAAATGNRQLPWRNSSLTEEFYFVPRAAAPATSAPTADAEIVFWQSVQDSADPRDLEAYLAAYPQGRFAALARNRLDALTPEPAARQEVAVEPRSEILVAAADVTLREAPGEAGGALGVVPAGEQVTVRGKVRGADWYEVEHPEVGRGYAYAPLLGAPPPATAPRPEVQPARLAAVSGILSYPAESRLRGRIMRETYSFAGWRDAAGEDSGMSLARDGGGRAAPALVREARTHNAVSRIAAFVLDDGVALVQHSRLDLPGDRWLDVGATATAWEYVREQGGRERGGGSTLVGGFQFHYKLVATADGRACVAFASVRGQDRLDGFFCRPPGVALGEGDVRDLLGRIRVERVIG